MPHDLISGFRVMLAIAIAAEMRHQAYRIAELHGSRHAPFFSIIAQKVEFIVGKHQRRIAVRNLAAKQRHGHDAPGDHGIDGNSALKPFRGSEQQCFCPTARLQHTKIVFDFPALQIVSDNVGGSPRRIDVKGGEQKPLDRLFVIGRIDLDNVDRRDGYRFRVFDGTGCWQCVTRWNRNAQLATRFRRAGRAFFLLDLRRSVKPST